jgi:hypothetical protein
MMSQFGLVLILLLAPQSLHGQLTKQAKDLNPKVLTLALKAASRAHEKGLGKKKILAVIDYSLPSTKKRLWVFDLERKKLLFHELVAHGKGSGENYAKVFSNQEGTLASSLGLYEATETYQGKHGYTLKLEGLEKGFNDNAVKRSIVIHSARYVTEAFWKKYGRLGRSWGCPALDKRVAKKAIDTLKGGSLVFVYSPDKNWLSASEFLRKESLVREKAIIRFVDDKLDLNGIGWMEPWALESGVDLEAWGIHALDKNVVFLFGGFNVPPGVIRSLLLRSDDGGRHWSEVMRPERGSSVTRVTFVEGGRGWALMQWMVEGPGPAWIYHTIDGGETWRRLVEIPIPNGHHPIVDLRFLDQLHGRMKVNLDTETERCCILHTDDGGLTWRWSGKCIKVESCTWRKIYKEKARDGSRWRLEVSRVQGQRHHAKVMRRLPSESSWSVTGKVPMSFEYKNGRVIVPQPESPSEFPVD